jgi:hypothetical protein
MKSFINHCCHKGDFGMDTKWHFFATLRAEVQVMGLGEELKG